MSAKLDNMDKVYVSVGGSYVVEKSVEDAKQFFGNQVSMLTQNARDCYAEILHIENNLYTMLVGC